MAEEFVEAEEWEEDLFCHNCRRIQQPYDWDWIYLEVPDEYSWFCAPKCCRDWLESTYVMPINKS